MSAAVFNDVFKGFARPRNSPCEVGDFFFGHFPDRASPYNLGN